MIATTPRLYVPLRDIATACEIDEHTIHHRLRPADWGVPGDWILRAGVTLYALDRVPALVASMRGAGESAAAEKLQAWLRWRRPLAPVPAGYRPPYAEDGA